MWYKEGFIMILSQTSVKDMYDIDNIVNVDPRKDGALVEFRMIATSDNNKWRKPGVVTDIIIERCALTNQQLRRLGINKNHAEKDIERLFEKTGDLDFIHDFMKASQFSTQVSVKLPRRFKAGIKGREPRDIKDTFYPVSVIIDGEDVSRAFETFDSFGSDVVTVASDALFGDFDFRRLKTELSNVEDLLAIRNSINSAECGAIGNAPSTMGFFRR